MANRAPKNSKPGLTYKTIDRSTANQIKAAYGQIIGGVKMTFTALEVHFGLRSNNGMAAYEVVKKYPDFQYPETVSFPLAIVHPSPFAK